MVQLRDDCFAQENRLLPFAVAERMLLERLEAVTGCEQVPSGLACGRILAEPVIAAHDLPPFDNSAVDGYAVRFADLEPDGPTRLVLAGRATAGHPFSGPVPQAGACIRVLTGASIPPGGFDTVLMEEDCQTGPEGRTVTVPPGIPCGANLRRAGEDTRAGSRILEAGIRLRPQELAWLAAMGHTQVAVRSRLRLGVFSSGDELREAGTPLAPGCVHDANRPMLQALLQGWGHEVLDLGILPDEPAAVGQAFDAALAAGCDGLVGSAGMSASEEDHIRPVIAGRGRVDFWRLAIKPGRPVAFGVYAGRPVIGLPGNPVAMLVTLVRLARPALWILSGLARPEVARCQKFQRVESGFDLRKKQARREWIRVRIEARAGELPLAQRFRAEGSGLISSLVFADGLVELDEDTSEVRQGDSLSFLSFAEWFS